MVTINKICVKNGNVKKIELLNGLELTVDRRNNDCKVSWAMKDAFALTKYMVDGFIFGLEDSKYNNKEIREHYEDKLHNILDNSRIIVFPYNIEEHRNKLVNDLKDFIAEMEYCAKEADKLEEESRHFFEGIQDTVETIISENTKMHSKNKNCVIELLELAKNRLEEVKKLEG